MRFCNHYTTSDYSIDNLQLQDLSHGLHSTNYPLRMRYPSGGATIQLAVPPPYSVATKNGGATWSRRVGTLGRLVHALSHSPGILLALSPGTHRLPGFRSGTRALGPVCLSSAPLSAHWNNVLR